MSIFSNLMDRFRRFWAPDRIPTAPRGWYIRGCGALLTLFVPLSFWLISLNNGPYSVQHSWVLRACPPVQPIPRAELIQHPERFQNRFIWVTGLLEAQKKQCIQLPCTKGKTCCFPCQTRLRLGPAPFAIPLSGTVHSNHSTPLRVICQYTTCDTSCTPFILKKRFAFAGKPIVKMEWEPRTRRPVFRLKSFSVHRFCPIHHVLDEKSPQTKQRLRDPRTIQKH